MAGPDWQCHRACGPAICTAPTFFAAAACPATALGALSSGLPAFSGCPARQTCLLTDGSGAVVPAQVPHAPLPRAAAPPGARQLAVLGAAQRQPHVHRGCVGLRSCVVFGMRCAVLRCVIWIVCTRHALRNDAVPLLAKLSVTHQSPALIVTVGFAVLLIASAGLGCTIRICDPLFYTTSLRLGIQSSQQRTAPRCASQARTPGRSYGS